MTDFRIKFNDLNKLRQKYSVIDQKYGNLREKYSQLEMERSEVLRDINETIFYKKYSEIRTSKAVRLKDENGELCENKCTCTSDDDRVHFLDAEGYTWQIVDFISDDFELQLDYWEHLSLESMDRLTRSRKSFARDIYEPYRGMPSPEYRKRGDFELEDLLQRSVDQEVVNANKD